LTYALLDSIVDSYFHTLEKIGDRLEALEEELIRQPTQDTLQRVHQLKGQLIFLRKSVWPLREVVNSLLHDEYALIHESTQVFLRDLYDHSVQIIDTVETFRDTATGLVDLYMSSISHRMNEVMQVLTIMASLFIPLTFIAGIYGMNFENMPELKHPWGYPAVWLLMLLCTGGMLTYFKRKKWF
jgi:magnesium transporter